MAKPRLKVYRAAMGFVEAVVAAPNQGEALKAWGTRQNLFAEGAASVTDDPEAVRPALAKPGVVLQRAVGGKGEFSDRAATPKAPAAEAKAKRKVPADRTALSVAEKRLQAVEAEHTEALAALTQERERLAAREEEINERGRCKTTEASKALEKARRKYVRAGGEL